MIKRNGKAEWVVSHWIFIGGVITIVGLIFGIGMTMGVAQYQVSKVPQIEGRVSQTEQSIAVMKKDIEWICRTMGRQDEAFLRRFSRYNDGVE